MRKKIHRIILCHHSIRLYTGSEAMQKGFSLSEKSLFNMTSREKSIVHPHHSKRRIEFEFEAVVEFHLIAAFITLNLLHRSRGIGFTEVVGNLRAAQMQEQANICSLHRSIRPL